MEDFTEIICEDYAVWNCNKRLMIGLSPLWGTMDNLRLLYKKFHHPSFDPTVITRQPSCGKVILSFMSVCSQTGPHVTITYDALALTVHPPALHPASDIWWSLLETYLNLFTLGPPTGTDIWWQ